MRGIKTFFIPLVAVFSVGTISADGLDFLAIKAQPELLMPVDKSVDLFETSPEILASIILKDIPIVQPQIEGSMGWLGVQDKTTISFQTLGIGAQFSLGLGTRFGLNLLVSGGLYQATRNDLVVSSPYFSSNLGASFRLSPVMSIKLDLGYKQLTGKSSALFQGLSIGIGAQITLGTTKGSIQIKTEKLDPVFPILHTWYDQNGFAQVEITNQEDGDIEDVQVGLFVPQYMDQVKFSDPTNLVSKNGKKEFQIKALFNDNVFKLNEDSKVAGDLQVKYKFLGEERTTHNPITLPVLNRNALSWGDDRRAAAFVGPKDPAVLRFTKYAAGLVREAGDQGLSLGLALGVGLFEGFKSLGIRYVKDPTTPFIELSQNTEAIDYLQYPFQTINVKGGDCDDLSILYCSMLESIGINAAFVTVPGHIFAAIDLELSPDEAQATFVSSKDLIYLDDKTYLPVEITIIGQGFLKAWQEGASEWRKYSETGEAKIIPIKDAQLTYPAVGIPGEDGRFTLPDSAPLMASWQQSMNEVIKREFDPRLAELKSDLSKNPSSFQIHNKIGILLARFGKLREAEGEFLAAIKLGSKAANNNLGQIYLKQKRFKEARNYLEAASKLYPDDKTIVEDLFRVYDALGDTEKAEALKKGQDTSSSGKGEQKKSRASDASEANILWLNE